MALPKFFMRTKRSFIFMNRFPAVVDSVIPNKPAMKAGLQKGDEIVGVNGKPTVYFDQLAEELKINKGKTIELDVLRNKQPLKLTANVGDDAKLGFAFDPKIAQKYLDKSQVTKEYSFLEAVPRGFTRTIDVLTMQIKQFKIIFNTKTQGYKKVGGPIAIVNNMHVEKGNDGRLSIDWEFFWGFTAMFSVWLAFLNLIPIPGLDGGHVLFTLWEIITGKPVPQKVLENAQMIGVIFLLGLMVLIFGNDIVKVISQFLTQKN